MKGPGSSFQAVSARARAREFARGDGAVSPVISTILMVAITVVLAAAAFVLLADIGGPGETAPTFGLQRDDLDDKLSVTSASAGADWARLTVQLASAEGIGAIRLGNTDPVDDLDYVGDAAKANGRLINTDPVPIADASHVMVAGEWIQFCRTDGLAGPVSVQIIDVVSNQAMGTFSFGTISACPL